MVYLQSSDLESQVIIVSNIKNIGAGATANILQKIVEGASDVVAVIAQT